MSQHDVDGLNSGYARALLDEYLESPDSVPEEWRALFESGGSELVTTHPGVRRLLDALANGSPAHPAPPAEAPPVPRPAAAPATPAPAPVATAPAAPVPAEPQAPAGPTEIDSELIGGVASAVALVQAFRTHGHLGAHLDPLGSEPVGDPALEPDRLHPPLTPELEARIPAAVLGVHVPGETAADVLPELEQTYCGTMAYEIEHVADHEQRVWLRQAIESGRFRRSISPDERLQLLRRLAQVEGFERYLRRTFLGQKQFSIEGLDAMVPMLDESVALAADAGAHEVVVGMAHRGRLNVLAHVVGRPYETILREFEGERTIEAVIADPEGGTGDVKYHLGATGTRTTTHGEIAVTLSSNPSHLEAVNPVVEGRARAEQTDRSSKTGRHDAIVALPILIHGDASFAGQGIVAETLNLDGLAGYSTGGTLHLIANNQVGFTTDPSDGRSTRYSSDLAKGFDVPIIHVNADDAEASIAATRLAMAFRQRFSCDVVVDLVGYRRFGHQEQDEPAYTQPLMAKAIADHPTVLDILAQRLVAEGVLTDDDVRELAAEVDADLKAAHERLRSALAPEAQPVEGRLPREFPTAVVTAVPADRLRALTDELLHVPDGFTVHPKLATQLARRRQALDAGGIDWAHAEGLAFASLLLEGIPIRLTGQDTERGTFSHRHLVLHDAETGERFTAMQNLAGATTSFEVFNSPLSEAAALGFEYGYSVAAPEALVLWEAQFGDFVNGAQIVIDQFIVSGLSKWGQTTRLTLLLPHGYEGNGPEHSSARLERFLQLAAQENLRLANCTTAAQYFHLLRRQALDASARPLMVMTPKGLLRLKQASSTLDELSAGAFSPVLDDPTMERARLRRFVRRLVICSGKLYYDLVGHESRAAAETVAIARLEQLYPFPVKQTAELVAGYPALEEVVWAQEEPQNMGPWRPIRHRLEEALPESVSLRFVGRPWRASPSEGYPTAHLREQQRIVRAALTAGS